MLPIIEGMMAGETPRWPDVLAIAAAAESVGLDSIWVIDHLVFPPTEVSEAPLGVWEGWSILAALAATTQRIRLGTFVVCTGFRNPALLAKMAATVDDISRGRLILGLGAGNNEFEHKTFGYAFDHRVSRFAEALQIIHPLLRTGHVDFAGHYYEAHNCELRLSGPRPSGPPIVVGTSGMRGTALAARYADGWNVPWGRIQNSAAGVALLRPMVDAACREAGRDPASLGRSAGVLVEVAGSVAYPPGYPGPWNRAGPAPPLTGSPAELAEQFRGFAREGIDHLQVWVNPTTPAGVEQLGKTVELL
jgi:alkanesulfonate monooxygenase SsuD/methylene tetrahydromethanopterin reductase-like flavin-dependent oxidoreductase (luciferase family)